MGTTGVRFIINDKSEPFKDTNIFSFFNRSFEGEVIGTYHIRYNFLTFAHCRQ